MPNKNSPPKHKTPQYRLVTYPSRVWNALIAKAHAAAEDRVKTWAPQHD